MVFLVRFEVLRQLTDALAQQRDLDFGTAGIGGMRAHTVSMRDFFCSLASTNLVHSCRFSSFDFLCNAIEE